MHTIVMCIYIYIYAQPPQNLPFQYSHLSRVQHSNAFVDVILSFCRREWWDIALHCIAMHCVALYYNLAGQISLG